jgi:hypothetical protein
MYTRCYEQGKSKKTDESRHESRKETTNDSAASILRRLYETKAPQGDITSKLTGYTCVPEEYRIRILVRRQNILTEVCDGFSQCVEESPRKGH